MHELTRLAYLNAMGVEQHISRYALPGAGATARLAVVVEPARSAPADQAAPKAPPMPKVAADSAKKQQQRAASQPQVVSKAPPTAGSAPERSFSLAVVNVGAWLWLEEITGAPLAREQVLLMRAMAQALGERNKQPQVAQFDWPMHGNAQLDRGPEAASAALTGFLQRHIDAHQCAALIALGEGGAQYLPAQLPVPLVKTLSTRQMLENPALKRQVWNDLQPVFIQA